jgi:hypothetical protein
MSFGFATFLSEGGQGVDIRPFLLGGAVGLAVLALLLLVTRVRGLGVVWRVMALVVVAGVGLISVIAWTTIENPASVVTDPESPFGRSLESGTKLAQNLGLLEIKPALGLWLLTVGTGIAGIGLLVPALRGHRFDAVPSVAQVLPPPTASAPSAGWYPDQVDGRFLRYFDGARWTDALRPRG